jgi:hypothetical protein
VTRASSTAAGRACECRALGGGCVLNDASFQRETRRNSHTARQDWSRACDVAHSRVAAEVISRRRCAFVSSVRDKQTVFETSTRRSLLLSPSPSPPLRRRPHPRLGSRLGLPRRRARSMRGRRRRPRLSRRTPTNDSRRVAFRNFLNRQSRSSLLRSRS